MAPKHMHEKSILQKTVINRAIDFVNSNFLAHCKFFNTIPTPNGKVGYDRADQVIHTYALEAVMTLH